MRTVFLNGEFVDEKNAHISPFDRGFMFGDAVYEVTSVVGGKLIDFAGHMRRLARSLAFLQMDMPISETDFLRFHKALVERNALSEGLVYLQISRGVADRDFSFPEAVVPQTVFMMTQVKNLVENPMAETGLKIRTVEDKRWQLCDVKTTQLLYPSLAKMEAKAQGADDAWLVRDGFVTEGTSNNSYIVTDDKKIITRELSHDILHGITREAVLTCAASLGYQVEERAFSVSEAENAAEAFISSAGTFVLPVTHINDHVLANGAPGPMARALRKEYLRLALQTAI